MKFPALVAAVTTAIALPAATPADAFCGFYVTGSDAPLFNDATQVVLMRQGTRTVLSMQNNYKGPPEAFAMVIPVPVVLHDGDVKTLPKDVFAHVEQMGAPRLVEYWEQDPCAPEIEYDRRRVTRGAAPGAGTAEPMKKDDLGVTVEAKFVVGEYEVVILSAKEATGLDTWLHQEKYKIPDGAAPLLRPYVESGMKFFVAKVDPAKVTFDSDHRAALSPLRFFYDSEEFALPIRLGLANSSGTQDLIVNILSPNQRYEVANYKNVTIPTNLDVDDSVKSHFGAFYTSLFDRTIEKNPGAVVTEYAWQASTCDPCPGPTLQPAELATLGADVLGGTPDKPTAVEPYSLVLTRLHARYGKDITADLSFKQAPPIVGGREFVVEGAQPTGGPGSPRLEERSRPDAQNNFQGRYAIRHPWTGPIRCEHPRPKRWGGPPAEIASQPGFKGGTQGATNLAFGPRDTIALPTVLKRDVLEIDIRAGASYSGDTATHEQPAVGSGSGSAVGSASAKPQTPAVPPETTKKTGCGCQSTDRNDLAGGALVVAASLLVRRRRRSR